MKKLKQHLRAALAVFVLALTAASLVSVVPSRAQLAAAQTWAGTATGTANALVLSVGNVGALGDLLGVPIRFKPASANTGPTTINVTSLGAITVLRPSSLGLVGLAGGEFQVGVVTTILYNGTNWELMGPVDMRPIGDTLEFRSGTTPPGYLLEDGTAVSRTTYAALFTAIGTTYGVGDGSTTFNLPDSRGVGLLALDNQGGAGAANRVTSAGSGCTATALTSTLCGSQNKTLITGNLPAYTPTGTANTSTSSTFQVGTNANVTQASSQSGTGGAIGFATTPTVANMGTILNGAMATTFTGDPQGGVSTPVSSLLPLSLVKRAIKY